MALEVDATKTGHIAQPRQVEADHVGDEGRIVCEALEPMVRGCDVSGRPLVPVGPVVPLVLVLRGVHHVRMGGAPAPPTASPTP